MTPRRPPANRGPRADELESCRPYLATQIAVVRPKVLVTLGSTALRGLLGKGPELKDIRGRAAVFEGIPVVPTYHPAAILYNRRLEASLRADLRKAARMARSKRLRIRSGPPRKGEAHPTDRFERRGDRGAGWPNPPPEAGRRRDLVPPEGHRGTGRNPRGNGDSGGPGGDRPAGQAPSTPARSPVFVLLASRRRQLRQDGHVLPGRTDRRVARSATRVRRGPLGDASRGPATPPLEERQGRSRARLRGRASRAVR